MHVIVVIEERISQDSRDGDIGRSGGLKCPIPACICLIVCQDNRAINGSRRCVTKRDRKLISKHRDLFASQLPTAGHGVSELELRPISETDLTRGYAFATAGE